MNRISVENIRKEFALHGTGSPSYGTVKDLFAGGWKRGAEKRNVVALDDISFAVAPGEAMGLIGNNGAGKSTLLRIISRILRPTSGRVRLEGRVASLLEVGAGFHPELTGRENVFLSGSMMGMNRREIIGKLDQITDFAGIGSFFDQPVRFYSTGMYMRLAFSVAAHIDTEILLLDEVLAVGDAAFQQQCIERVREVGRNGQSVILVSHNMTTMVRLCGDALLLDGGRMSYFGSASEAAARYLKTAAARPGERRYAETETAPQDRVVRLRSLRVRTREGATLAAVSIGDEFGIEMEFEVLEGGATLMPSLIIRNEWSAVLWTTDTCSEWHGRPRPAGRYKCVAWIPPHLLSAGSMRVSAAIHSFHPWTVHLEANDIVLFHALECAGGARGQFAGYIDGGVRPLLDWSVERDA